MNLLLLLPHLALGGADKFNLDLLGQLRAHGWRCTAVTTRSGPHSWRAAFAAVADEIIELAEFAPAEQPIRLVQLARDRGYDMVLISNSAVGYASLPYLRAHLPTVAFADYCHMEEPDIGGGYPRMSVDAAASLDLQIVSSQHLRDLMAGQGSDEHNQPNTLARRFSAGHAADAGNSAQIQVCTINIDANDWNAADYDRVAIRAVLGVALDAPVVLYAGRLARQKQPLLALAVMREVVRQRPNTVFLIAGDGQFAPYVRGFVRAQRLERHIRFLGPQPSERMRDLLAASDILFLPSQMEGISLAIYEAMAMGVVPVSADVGGQRELVTPEVGVLVQRGPNERRDYTAALLALIDDPQRRQSLGAAARLRVATHFRLNQMSQRMLELFELARERHAAAPRPVSAAAALASARAAVALAEAEAAAQVQIDRPLRRWLRNLFWQAVERGAWLLVPALERVRGM